MKVTFKLEPVAHKAKTFAVYGCAGKGYILIGFLKLTKFLTKKG